jgi:tetratricopeptide (TPR) repeat protein
MSKYFVAAVIVLACGAAASADYVSERQAAIDLVRAGKQQEALSAFLKMAEGHVTDFQKSDALEQACLRAMALREYDRATELAGKIPLAPVAKTCRLRIMEANRQWQGLVDTFKDEDIAGWPDDLVGEASGIRGRAYVALKDGQRAEGDLKRAADYLTESNSKGLALIELGDLYANLLKDDARALESYRKVYTTANVYKQAQAAISAAGILRRQNKADDAIRELNKVDPASMEPVHLRAALLFAYGETYAAQGQKAEALAKYREALAVAGGAAWLKSASATAIKQLEAPGSR